MTKETPVADEPEATPEPKQPVPDGLELHKDGTVTVVVGKRRYRLRRPKVGELQDLREQIAAIDDASILALGKAGVDKKALDEQYPPADREKDPMMAAEYQVAIRGVDREMNASIEAGREAWVRDAVGLLGDKKLPADVREWEQWLLSPVTISQLLAHWQTVPLARGVG